MDHGGNLRYYKEVAKRNDIIDFSANINPLGIPDWVRPIVGRHFHSLSHYPDIDYIAPRLAMSDYYRISKENILLVNGVAEALSCLKDIIDVKRVITLDPSFGGYQKIFNQSIEEQKINSLVSDTALFAKIEETFDGGPTSIILNNPQNPTGRLYPREKILSLIKKYPQNIFIIDEAFLEFTDQKSLAFEVGKFSNLIVLKSYTKLLALPGLRMGAIYSGPKIISKFKKRLPTWNVNNLSSEILCHYYKNEIKPLVTRTRQEVSSLKKRFRGLLNSFPSLKVWESEVNFFLLEFENEDALKVYEYLLKEYGIATRTCQGFLPLSLKKFLRLAVRPSDEQDSLIASLNNYFKKGKKTVGRKTPAIMLQGTTSNAGKSLLATAFCRIFHEDGLNVSPFKSQNMALNSFVTKEGCEIGRAQAVQAMASKKDASVLMNPILLKPNSDIGSQVILHGKPVKHMHFKEYFKVKLDYFEEVKKAYDEMADLSDVMVIEGAGSPSEINLKKNDIVNMNVARYANANVYLASDIDRGGMFASFLGTFDTFKGWEHNLVKGLIINRFRGDKSLLDPGIKFLEDSTDVPVVGCIPHINNHMIPEEDCIEFKSGSFNDQSILNDRLDIAVIDTPRISNFTDIDALRGEPDTRVRMVQTPSELGKPHIILLCGSKSVYRDLAFIKKSGLDKEILNLYSSGTSHIVGICGGYQFLSRDIFDPDEVESGVRHFKGLGVLELSVEMKKEKHLSQVEANFLPWKSKIKGYEIHHGQTKVIGSNLKDIVTNSNNSQVIGHSTLDGRAWGSYLHGIFDDNLFRRQFLDDHRVKRGKQPIKKVVFEYDVDKAITNLAQIVRKSIDLKKIYEDLRL